MLFDHCFSKISVYLMPFIVVDFGLFKLKRNNKPPCLLHYKWHKIYSQGYTVFAVITVSA